MQTTYRDKLKLAFTPGQDAVRKQKETHAGLWLDKYIKTQEKGSEGRQALVDEVAQLTPPKAYNLFYKRWEKSIVESKAKTHEAHTKGRMAVGLGDESVLETSIALHHTYGVPYIPGSALKGLAANYAHQRLGNAWKKGSPAYKTVFGDTENAGYVVFFDALYIPGSGFKADPKNHDKNEQVLYPDIITVHHQAYYQGDKNAAPADWDSPIPVPFLSATGSYLLALTAPDLNEAEAKDWLTTTFQILANALSERGIGAKTSSGYGRMKIEEVDVIPTSTKEEEAQKNAPPPKRDRQHVKPPTVGGELIQEAKGIKDSTILRERFHLEDAVALLTYREYDPLDIVVVIGTDYPEAANWNDGNTHRCRVERIDEQEEGFVVYCKPVQKKNTQKNKKVKG